MLIICAVLLLTFANCQTITAVSAASAVPVQNASQSLTSNEVYAVLSGFPTTASTIHPTVDNTLWRLDVKNQGWGAYVIDSAQWIQVSSIQPVLWTAVITQGKEVAGQWVTQYQVTYSQDGVTWQFVDNGRLFTGNKDRTTHVRNNFNTKVYARAIRIQPTKWSSWIALRFDAIFLSY